MPKANIANTTLAHAQKKPDVSLAKPVDRLHRIANDKQGPTIARHPAARQFFNQSDLRRAGVLKFIDQQMPNAVIERLRQIGRRFVVAERQPGPGGNFDKIYFAGLLKSQPQLPGSQAQQAGKAFDSRPFRRTQYRVGQTAHLAERNLDVGNVGEIGKQAAHRLLLRFQGLIRREADVLVQRLAQRAATG